MTRRLGVVVEVKEEEEENVTCGTSKLSVAPEHPQAHICLKMESCDSEP